MHDCALRLQQRHAGDERRSAIGLLWDSPLGPIRFDFAWPFMKEAYDQTQWFRFSGGDDVLSLMSRPGARDASA